MGGVRVCDTVCLGMMWTSGLSYDETPRKVLNDKWVPYGGFIFRQISEFRESLLVHLLFSRAYSSKQSICQSGILWVGLFCGP